MDKSQRECLEATERRQAKIDSHKVRHERVKEKALMTREKVAK